jgi:hypothetical protein
MYSREFAKLVASAFNRWYQIYRTKWYINFYHISLVIEFDRILLVAHASCVFKGKVWVTGGRTNLYTMYNLLESYKAADVWHTEDGGEHIMSCNFMQLH